MKWIGCQIGARENYAIPQALNERNLLAGLFTDIWFDNKSVVSTLVARTIPRLSGRNTDIDKLKITSFNASALWFEASEWACRHQGWMLMYNRNRWFQDKVLHSKEFEGHFHKDNSRSIVFCYSYAALKILKRAKEYGCITVLGQIDGGPEEENIVANAVTKHSNLQPGFERVPEAYWDDWRQECELADRIMVNSDWSRQLIDKAGIADNKIRVVPLMYNAGHGDSSRKEYPEKFTHERPLRVLFLGSLIIRKGIGQMLEAVNNMRGQPVEFWFVGQEGVKLTDDLKQNRQLHWIGPVPRSETAKYYRMCDVFVFPTLSDGFGLTQLEAMSYGLPVIASDRCGSVVEHYIDGLKLSEVKSDNIVNALSLCMNNSKYLDVWSDNALKKVLKYSSQHIFPALIKEISI